MSDSAEKFPPSQPTAAESACPSGASSCGCSLTKSVRVLVAILVLGTAAAYGALTTKPELIDYLPYFAPDSAGGCSLQGRKAGACCDHICPLTPASATVADDTPPADESAFFAGDDADPVPGAN